MAETMNYIELAETVSRVVMNSGLPVLRVSYDAEGDVLYVHFTERPIAADDSEFIGDDTVVRFRGGEVVGVTILNASRLKEREK
ncbi:MAG: DUF2283 domain-containing protein [Moorellaceae bacterium]